MVPEDGDPLGRDKGTFVKSPGPYPFPDQANNAESEVGDG